MNATPLDPLYTQKLLEYASHIPRLGHLSAPDAVATCHAKLCGSTVTVEINILHSIITDYAHTVEACALGKTSASIVAHYIIGETLDDVATLYPRMKAFLRAEMDAPQGRWHDLHILKSIQPYPQRHASTLLVFEALEKAINALPKSKHQ
jgi:NifU-like protein involved in Fe-S cluster formation